ncbi:hypothetical protein [Solibacillus daqui]|uniref:hypothetical protein n=1 Tax=Solibacillus daqui TaxID=2912187 RepID=UPI0023650ECC|nr:hypothetical protein [Solibacillus daqui]
MELLFDTIPPDTKKLEIKLEPFYSKEKINLVVPLTPVLEGIIGPKELQILSISKQNDYTELTIRSEADVIYDKVTLQTT